MITKIEKFIFLNKIKEKIEEKLNEKKRLTIYWIHLGFMA
jgi:hypothetical protein